jgi:two-component system cell cycle sensor histidine kinase/response regulator CckA
MSGSGQTKGLLKNPEQYLKALVNAQKALLSSPEDVPFQDFLDCLGPLCGTSRMYVFLNHTDSGGHLLMSQVAEWCDANSEPQINNPDLQNLSYETFFPRWKQVLKGGGNIAGAVFDFPPEERDILEPQKILSILIIPIMADGHFIGFVGLDNCESADSWSGADQDYLELAALSLGQAVLGEKKRRQMRQAMEAVHGVLENIPQAVFWKDLNSVFLGCNRALAEAVGLSSPEEIIGKTDYDLSPTREEAEAYRAADRRVMDSGEPQLGIEEELHRADGRVVFLRTNKLPMRDARGNVSGVLCTFEDVTEAKRAAKEIENTQRFLTTVMDHLPDPLIVINRDYSLALANRAAKELLPSGQTDGPAPCHLLIYGKDAPCEGHETPCPLRNILESGEPFSTEHVCVEGPSQTRRFDVSGAPIFDEEGRVIQIVEMYREVTEQKRTQDMLRQAQKMEAVGQLAGGIAHDFNNMLQVINGYADIALSKLAPDHPAAGSVQEVLKAGMTAAELVQHLLAFSHQQIIEPGSLDINHLIESMSKMLRRLIGEHIRLDFIPSDEVGSIFADASQMRQVLMNLCVNARDAMPDGGTITIETGIQAIEPGDDKTFGNLGVGDYVILSVTDTGRGMPPEVRERIFEPFFTTKELGQGTGLGLATVYGIVRQNHGHISVYSEEGKGSVFKVYLPAESSQQRNQQTKDDAGERLPDASGGETILVVEDNPMILAQTRDILLDAGYQVFTAADGMQAVDFFKKQGPAVDLVVMDVVMPNMSGKEAMKQILEMRPGLSHLYVSGYSSNAVHTGFIKEAGLNLLSKPYTPAALKKQVRQILNTP